MKKEKGITLIALVITIIILLILAGITISQLIGSGLFEKAKLAKNRTKEAEEIENQRLSEYETQINELGGGTKNDEPTVSAKDVLKINYTATDEASKSPFVKYNGLDCRVLYNDDINGLQIITAECVESVSLGYNDSMVTASDFTYSGSGNINDKFKIAAASYNNAVDNLNTKAKSYMDSKGVASDARCLGSIPTLNSNSKFQGDTTSEMWSDVYSYLTTYGWNNILKAADTNYLEDVKQINRLGLCVSSGGEWLASRYTNSTAPGAGFYISMTNWGGNYSYYCLCGLQTNGIGSSLNHNLGFRPVFLLPSDVVVSRGDGNSENPYIVE